MGDIHLLSTFGEAKNSRCYLNRRGPIEFFFGSRDMSPKVKCKMQDGMPDGSLLVLYPSDPIVDPSLLSNLEVVRFGDGALEL